MSSGEHEELVSDAKRTKMTDDVPMEYVADLILGVPETNPPTTVSNEQTPLLPLAHQATTPVFTQSVLGGLLNYMTTFAENASLAHLQDKLDNIKVPDLPVADSLITPMPADEPTDPKTPIFDIERKELVSQEPIGTLSVSATVVTVPEPRKAETQVPTPTKKGGVYFNYSSTWESRNNKSLRSSSYSKSHSTHVEEYVPQSIGKHQYTGQQAEMVQPIELEAPLPLETTAPPAPVTTYEYESTATTAQRPLSHSSPTTSSYESSRSSSYYRRDERDGYRQSSSHHHHHSSSSHRSRGSGTYKPLSSSSSQRYRDDHYEIEFHREYEKLDKLRLDVVSLQEKVLRDLAREKDANGQLLKDIRVHEHGMGTLKDQCRSVLSEASRQKEKFCGTLEKMDRLASRAEKDRQLLETLERVLSKAEKERQELAVSRDQLIKEKDSLILKVKKLEDLTTSQEELSRKRDQSLKDLERKLQKLEDAERRRSDHRHNSSNASSSSSSSSHSVSSSIRPEKKKPSTSTQIQRRPIEAVAMEKAALEAEFLETLDNRLLPNTVQEEVYNEPEDAWN